jgi:hypothetical protein
MEIIKTIEYKSIETVRKEFLKDYNPKYIFRGQSNGNSFKQENWDLTSSFKRFFPDSQITFHSFIVNNLDKNIFENYFSEYNYPRSKELSRASFIEKLYYLQHYGIPTCLIDFTKDPLIALYFAFSGLRLPSIRRFSNDSENTFSFDRYITVYQINTELLKKAYGIKEIEDLNFCWNYSQFNLEFVGYRHIRMALDLRPKNNIKLLDNYNLEHQNGCFILYDNTETDDTSSLDKSLLNIYNNYLNKDIEEPVLVKHNFYLNFLHSKKSEESLSYFIRNRKKLNGKQLFNDIQGLKFDLMQLHDDW